MSVSGTLFGLEQPSQSRLNRKTIFVGTGAEISAIPLTSAATVFLCTSTGSGFTANEIYVTKSDGSGRVSMRRAHTHATSADVDGGDIYDVDVGSAGDRLAIERLTKGGYFVVTVDAGTIDSTRIENAVASNTVAMILKTTATINKWTQVQDGGKALSFGSKIEWRIKMQVNSAADILWRQGVNMELVSDAGTGTENRFGMEGCSGGNAFVNLICSNGGGTRTNQSTGLGATAMKGYAMYYTPGVNILWKDSLGNEQTLSTNVPSSGSIASDRMLRYGIKNTAAVEKLMYIAADALYGKIGDTLWVS